LANDIVRNKMQPEDLIRFFNKQKGVNKNVLQAIEDSGISIKAHFKTEVGQELLKDDIDDFQRLLVLVVEEKATPQELAEFRVVKRRLEKISQRIETFLEGVKKFSGGNNGRE
jgi:hypothetical protein